MTLKVGIDQSANLKKLKRLQERGIIVLHQAHNLEDWRSQVIQQGRPFRVGVSKVGGLDGWADEKWEETLRLFGATRETDAEHLYACYLNGIDYFLTEDVTDFIAHGRREQLEALLGVKIRRTEEFITELRTHGINLD
jgi:hypothetical protein